MLLHFLNVASIKQSVKNVSNFSIQNLKIYTVKTNGMEINLRINDAGHTCVENFFAQSLILHRFVH